MIYLVLGLKVKFLHIFYLLIHGNTLKVFGTCYDSLTTPRRGYITVMLKQASVSEELKSRGVEKILKKISADVNKMKKKAKKEMDE